ncbi:MAG: type II toxin-antitoxin system Phd/YefM family antitoxin [Caulobacteraceae bacterium]
MSRALTAREANQQFSKVLAQVEQGETVRITKHGRTVAELRPATDERADDPEWRAKFEEMIAFMEAAPKTGYRVGKITEEDKYGEVYKRWEK